MLALREGPLLEQASADVTITPPLELGCD